MDEIIVQEAARYGIPLEILHGVVYAEMGLDTDITDFIGDTILSILPFMAEYVNVGPGVGNIHLSTARSIANHYSDYYSDRPDLGLDIGANESDTSLASRLLDTNYSIQVIAAYVRQLADYRFGSNEQPLTESHADLSQWTLDDGLAIWHGYRYGVPDVSPGGQGFRELIDYQDRTVALSVVAIGDGAQGSITGAIPFFCSSGRILSCE
jgi:hypothetical protein